MENYNDDRDDCDVAPDTSPRVNASSSEDWNTQLSSRMTYSNVVRNDCIFQIPPHFPPPIFTLPVASILLLVIQPVNNLSVEQRYKIISITLMHLHHRIIIIIIIIMQSTVLSFNAAVHATALHCDHLPTVLHPS